MQEKKIFSEMATKSTGQGKGKGHGKNPKKSARVSRSARAGLQFPVGRMHRKLKLSTSCNKVGPVAGTAAVYCSAVIEYLVAEIVELAGNACRDMRLQRLTPRHLMLAIRGDEELDTLIKGTIAGSGVIPHVHRSLHATILTKKSN